MHYNVYLISVDVVRILVEDSGTILIGPKSPLMALDMVFIVTEDQLVKSSSAGDPTLSLQLAHTVVRFPLQQVALMMRYSVLSYVSLMIM